MQQLSVISDWLLSDLTDEKRVWFLIYVLEQKPLVQRFNLREVEKNE